MAFYSLCVFIFRFIFSKILFFLFYIPVKLCLRRFRTWCSYPAFLMDASTCLLFNITILLVGVQTSYSGIIRILCIPFSKILFFFFYILVKAYLRRFRTWCFYLAFLMNASSCLLFNITILLVGVRTSYSGIIRICLLYTSSHSP